MREWTVHEDQVLNKLLNTDGVEAACLKLNRPKTAIEMRLAFLKDHEIVAGAEGEITHMRRTTRLGSTITSRIASDPPPYLSALGQKTMNATNY